MAALTLCVGACAREAEDPAKPNILVYLPDTLRADHLGVYGYARDTSPRLSEFSEDGIVFERTYSQASWTKASVGTLFSGLYPSRHGAIRREHRLRGDFPTLAGLLLDHGYRTAAIIRNPIVLPEFGFGRGFERVIDLATDEPASGAGAILEHALEFLGEDDPRPFFLYLHAIDPHHPYDAPSPFDTRFRAPTGEETPGLIADYDNEIAYGDHTFGELMDQLLELGLYDDTLIVFLSDHGEEFKEHRRLSHGHSLYQEQLLVPLIIKLPRREHAGRRIDEPVRIVDVFPSLLELVGVIPPAGIDGISLLPLLREGGGRSYEPALFFEQDLDRFELTALIDGSHKVIRRLKPEADAGVQVFDLASDPLERVNLLEKQPVLAQRMLELLDLYESAVRGGIYIDFTNAVGAESRSHLVGAIEITGGTVATLAPMLLEPEDSVTLDGSRTRISFDLQLANPWEPIKGVGPPTDVDRIRFDSNGESASYTISLVSGSANAEQFDIAMGATAAPSPSPLPWTSRGHESDVLATDRTTVGIGVSAAPYARVYEIALPASDVVEIDEKLDAQLRALGYLGDE